MYKTYTAKAIDDRNKAHIEAINNPDNVLGLFKGERNWMLPEEVKETVSVKEEIKAEVKKAVNPFLKGMVFGMVVALVVFLGTMAVVLL